MKKIFTGLMAGVFLVLCSGAALAADCNFVASKGSNKYHLPDCGIAKNIKPENRVCFVTQEEAAKAGYGPCGVCKPDEKMVVIGSKDSDKYHLPACGLVKKIKPENKIEFKSPAEALKAGYSPCGFCKPPRPQINKEESPKA